jgi:hypothetical protein
MVPQPPTPQATPQQVPVATPPITQQTPQMVPQPPTPQAVQQPIPQTPSQVLPAGGSVLPFGSRATPFVIPRPTPRAGVPEELVQLPVAAGALITAPSTAQRWTAGPVTAEPGRQAHHALPTFRTPEGHLVQCLAGGYGWRYAPGKDGSTRLVGRVPVLRSTDVIVRDVPANQMMSPECAVIVKRRYDE